MQFGDVPMGLQGLLMVLQVGIVVSLRLQLSIHVLARCTCGSIRQYYGAHSGEAHRTDAAAPVRGPSLVPMRDEKNWGARRVEYYVGVFVTHV